MFGGPGNDTPPQTVPLAPRGSVPDVTAATGFGTTALGVAPVGVPAGALPSSADVVVPQPVSPGPDFIPPQMVPVAPRGEMPDTSTAASALPDVAVPAGIVPTLPGVLAGATRAGPASPSLSSFAIPGFPLEVPALPHLGFPTTPSFDSPALPAAPVTSDEAKYYFTSAFAPVNGFGSPVPQLPDSHEVFDVHRLRADFPILRETVNGHPLIWFDNAATTQKPQAVIDRIAYFYAHENSNIHRAAHELAARATDAYEEARETVRRFIGAPKSEQVIFVRGTTEAINLVAKSWGAKHLRPGDEIVVTILEHHANIVPWQMIAAQTGAVLKFAPVDDAGNLLLDRFEDLLGPRTKFVSATHLSNALGTVNPVHDIVAMGHRYGARVLIDGAQSVPHVPIDVAGCGADFFVFSGHKIFGPTGIGVLYGTEEVLAETPPWQGGGNMIADVTTERAIYQGLPNKFEAGTGNIADAVGLGEALRYVEKVGVERIAEYEHALLEYATPRLAAIPGVRIVGTADHKASVLSFVLAGHDSIEVGKALNSEGIAVRAGHHCAQPILRRMGLEMTVRPSFAFYNTFDEIDTFLAAVRRIADGSLSPGQPTLDDPNSRHGCGG
ncbi:MAG: family 2A encapsulin nanocompartment cargo protein cysteine desulfurase [Mycobacterium sp.]